MRHTLDQLAELPELATTVFTTWDHPNPGLTADRTGTHPGSRPPTRLEVWDALRPDTKGDLALLHGWAITIDEVSDGELAPIPEATPTWTGVCRYLSETITWWCGHIMAEACSEEIRNVHRRLRTLARIPPPARYKCPRCNGRAHMRDNGSWMSCESCHEVIDHRAEIARAMATREPVTVGRIAAELGEKRDTIKKWIARRGLEPAEVRRGVKLYDIEEVQRRRVVA